MEFKEQLAERKADVDRRLEERLGEWRDLVISGEPLGDSGFGRARIVPPNKPVRLEKLDQVEQTVLPEAGKGPKRLRPIAFQYAAEAFLDEEAADWDGILDRAAEFEDPVDVFMENIREASHSLEFDHNFTLIFDDIHDEDDERRESDPAYIRETGKAEERGLEGEDAEKRGRDQAHLDGLYAREFVPLVLDSTDFTDGRKWGLLGVLNEANRELVYGQSQDLWMELVDLDSYFEGEPGEALDFLTEGNESPEELYLQMIDGKTNALVAAAFRGGAYMAGADHEQLRELEKYARSVGTAFQIKDDINEIVSAANPGEEEESHGKGDSDLYKGKATISFATAYEMLDQKIRNSDSTERTRDLEQQKARLEYHYGRWETNEKEMARTAEAILEHHAGEELADVYVEQALEHLQEADPGRLEDRLEEFAYYVTERDY